MIKNNKDYKRFLRAEHPNVRSVNFFFLWLKTSFNPTRRFLLLLRTCEYYKNVNHQFYNKPVYLFLKYLKYRLATRLSFSIPENVAGEGLQLPHYGTIVINGNARLGKYCRIHVCVNIGASGGGKAAPHIGDYVYIAPGAKIYGDIIIADRVAIAANAAVSNSFLNSDVLIGGIPAKEIAVINIKDLITVNHVNEDN